MNIVIMQPCYLPWQGYFALMKHSDIFVFLDDVALPQGRSLQTRVAIIKDKRKMWLSVPVKRKTGQLICDVEIAGDHWRRKHTSTIKYAYADTYKLIHGIYEQSWRFIADLNMTLIERIADSLNINSSLMRSSKLNIPGRGSDKILNLCRHLGAKCYISGHGGARYLKHEEFERNGIRVNYADYELVPYRQATDSFDPFVTVLDLIENVDRNEIRLGMKLIPWENFLSISQ